MNSADSPPNAPARPSGPRPVTRRGRGHPARARISARGAVEPESSGTSLVRIAKAVAELPRASAALDLAARAQCLFAPQRCNRGGQPGCEPAPPLEDGHLENGFAAGDGDGGARNVAREWIGQHDIGGGELGWLSRAVHWHLLAEACDRILGQRGGYQRRPDWSGCDSVGADALARKQLRQSGCEIL